MSFGVVFQVTVIEEAVKYIDELHRALFERLQSKGNIPRNQNPLYHDKIDNERNSTQNIISYNGTMTQQLFHSVCIS